MRLQVAENKESQDLLETMKKYLMQDPGFFRGRLSKIVKKTASKEKIYPCLKLDNGTKIIETGKIEFALFSRAQRQNYASEEEDMREISRMYASRQNEPDAKNISVMKDEKGKLTSERVYSDEEDETYSQREKAEIFDHANKRMDARKNRPKPQNSKSDIGMDEIYEKNQEGNYEAKFDSYLREMLDKNEF
jgi:hypothetical protein